jgi:hypothetical protein
LKAAVQLKSPSLKAAVKKTLLLIYKPPGELKQRPVVVVSHDDSVDPDSVVPEEVTEYFVVAGWTTSGGPFLKWVKNAGNYSWPLLNEKGIAQIQR